MREIIIPINKENASYMERLNYELNFTKDVIQRIIEAHPDDANIINSPAFKSYQKQGAELQMEYAVAVTVLEAEYLPEQLKGHKYSWNIPVDSGKLIVSVLCDCDIPGIDFKEA